MSNKAALEIMSRLLRGLPCGLPPRGAFGGVGVCGVLLWFVALLGGLATVSAQSLRVETTAQALLQEDVSHARAQALSFAMTAAVEQAVEQTAPVLRRRLYLVSHQAAEFVPSYRVLEESQRDGRLLLRVVCEVDVTSLLQRLQTVLPPNRRNGKKTRLWLCVRDGFPAQPAFVEEVHKWLENQNFAVETGPGCLSNFPRLQFDADLLSASEEVRGTSPKQLFAKARGTWQFSAAADAKPQSETTEAMALAGQAEVAQAQAMAQLSVPLVSRLLDRLGLSAQVNDGVLIVVGGLRSFGSLRKLWRALWGLPGVTSVQPWHVTPKLDGEGLVLFRLQTNTDVQTLGTALYRTPIASLTVQVSPLSPTALRLDCVSSSELPSAENPESP